LRQRHTGLAFANGMIVCANCCCTLFSFLHGCCFYYGASREACMLWGPTCGRSHLQPPLGRLHSGHSAPLCRHQNVAHMQNVNSFLTQHV
jgi:hypothetical protein